jgi:glycosyltransferase involved in cell wall biosynthesis
MNRLIISKKAWLPLLFYSFMLNASNLEFMIIIPSYNNERIVRRNIESAAKQKTSVPFHIYYINDASTDKTKDAIESFTKERKLESLVTVIHNKKRLGALENIYITMHRYGKNNQVAILLDGDDALSYSGVLERLKKEYTDPAVWATYGQFVYYPQGILGFSTPVSPEVVKKRSFRQSNFVFQHLRTFRVPLFKNIKKEDLLDAQGNFFSMAWDLAIMLPIAEMCAPFDEHSPNHIKHIDDILYMYNAVNPQSDFRTDRELQLKLDSFIRSKNPYSPLKHLPGKN